MRVLVEVVVDLAAGSVLTHFEALRPRGRHHQPQPRALADSLRVLALSPLALVDLREWEERHRRLRVARRRVSLQCH